jgi:trimeric autotransporter adhesin
MSYKGTCTAALTPLYASAAVAAAVQRFGNGMDAAYSAADAKRAALGAATLVESFLELPAAATGTVNAAAATAVDAELSAYVSRAARDLTAAGYALLPAFMEPPVEPATALLWSPAEPGSDAAAQGLNNPVLVGNAWVPLAAAPWLLADVGATAAVTVAARRLIAAADGGASVGGSGGVVGGAAASASGSYSGGGVQAVVHEGAIYVRVPVGAKLLPSSDGHDDSAPGGAHGGYATGDVAFVFADTLPGYSSSLLQRRETRDHVRAIRALQRQLHARAQTAFAAGCNVRDLTPPADESHGDGEDGEEDEGDDGDTGEVGADVDGTDEYDIAFKLDYDDDGRHRLSSISVGKFKAGGGAGFRGGGSGGLRAGGGLGGGGGGSGLRAGGGGGAAANNSFCLTSPHLPPGKFVPLPSVKKLIDYVNGGGEIRAATVDLPPEPRTLVECVRAVSLLIPRELYTWFRASGHVYGDANAEPANLLYGLCAAAASMLTPGLAAFVPGCEGYRPVPDISSDDAPEGGGGASSAGAPPAGVDCAVDSAELTRRSVCARADRFLATPPGTLADSGTVAAVDAGRVGGALPIVPPHFCGDHTLSPAVGLVVKPRKAAATAAAPVAAAAAATAPSAEVAAASTAPPPAQASPRITLSLASGQRLQEQETDEQAQAGVRRWLHSLAIFSIFTKRNSFCTRLLPCTCAGWWALHCVTCFTELNAAAGADLSSPMTSSQLGRFYRALRQTGQDCDRSPWDTPMVPSVEELCIDLETLLVRRNYLLRYLAHVIGLFVPSPPQAPASASASTSAPTPACTMQPQTPVQPPASPPASPPADSHMCEHSKNAIAVGSPALVFFRIFTRLACQLTPCGRDLLKRLDPAEGLPRLPGGDLPATWVDASRLDADNHGVGTCGPGAVLPPSMAEAVAAAGAAAGIDALAALGGGAVASGAAAEAAAADASSLRGAAAASDAGSSIDELAASIEAGRSSTTTTTSSKRSSRRAAVAAAAAAIAAVKPPEVAAASVTIAATTDAAAAAEAAAAAAAAEAAAAAAATAAAAERRREMAALNGRLTAARTLLLSRMDRGDALAAQAVAARGTRERELAAARAESAARQRAAADAQLRELHTARRRLAAAVAGARADLDRAVEARVAPLLARLRVATAAATAAAARRTAAAAHHAHAAGEARRLQAQAAVAASEKATVRAACKDSVAGVAAQAEQYAKQLQQRVAAAVETLTATLTGQERDAAELRALIDSAGGGGTGSSSGGAHRDATGGSAAARLVAAARNQAAAEVADEARALRAVTAATSLLSPTAPAFTPVAPTAAPAAGVAHGMQFQRPGLAPGRYAHQSHRPGPPVNRRF